MKAFLRLLGYLRPFWFVALAAPLFMMLEVGMDLLQPHLVQRVIDEGVASRDMAAVLHLGGLMVGTAVLSYIGGAACGMTAVRAGYRYGAALRADLFRRIQRFSFGNLDRLETGALITRLTNDANQLQDMVSMLLRGMVRLPLLLIGSITMALITSPRLGWITLVLLPVLVVALVWVTRRTFPRYREVQSNLDDLNNVMQENLSGVRVVKAFVREDHESARFARANASLAERLVSAIRTGAIMQPVMTMTLSAGIVAALWLGGRQLASGGIEVGEVVAYINYLMQSIMALMMFSNLVVQLSRAQASAQRLADLLDEHPALPDSGSKSLPACRGAVAFENVTFSYRRGEGDPVLKNISFTAAPGETVAILGTTGAGKSSLVQLIPRFYDPDAGRVTLDGVDVRDIATPDLRRHVGIALQESVLFHDTIRANIAMGRPEATEDEIIAAARAAQAEDFINRLPEGYDTVIGQRGSTLSGGQKQRLAIARALLPRYPVLILDDSTSAVDVRTEAAIQAALNSTSHAGQTRIIVAQRISSVIGADKILVIEDGRIVGQGTHAELLATNDVYRDIHDSQVENAVLAQ